MFRKMRRFKQQISDEKCVEILTNEPRGVLALYGENGYPYALPLDHLYDDGKLYFHQGKSARLVLRYGRGFQKRKRMGAEH